MTTDSKKQKGPPSVIVNPEVKGYGNDLFLVKKANESKQFLDKHGFPKAFQHRSGNS
jgi:hypothetical protein